jgi:hypothetical protein
MSISFTISLNWWANLWVWFWHHWVFHARKLLFSHLSSKSCAQLKEVERLIVIQSTFFPPGIKWETRRGEWRLACFIWYFAPCKGTSVFQRACKVSQQTTDWQRNEGDSLLHVPRHAIYMCMCQLCVACILEASARLLEPQYVIEVSHLPLLFVRLAALWCVTRHNIPHKTIATIIIHWWMKTVRDEKLKQEKFQHIVYFINPTYWENFEMRIWFMLFFFYNLSILSCGVVKRSELLV